MAASSALSLVSTTSRLNTHFTFSTSLGKSNFSFQSPIISSPSSPISSFSSTILKFSQSQEPKKREDLLAVVMVFGRKPAMNFLASPISDESSKHLLITEDTKLPLFSMPTLSLGATLWFAAANVAHASGGIKTDAVYEIGELFELGIQLSYLLLLLGLLGAGTFFVIRQVLLRRELDLSAKELQEQVRSGDNSATGLFELGAVMLRRKFYPAATKYLLQAIDQWDGEYEDLAQVYNALGVSYVRDEKLDKGIAQFETAVKIQPGYVTAWNNLGDAYEKKKDINAALKAFEEVLLFDPDNKVAKPRRDGLKERVEMYKGVPVKSKRK